MTLVAALLASGAAFEAAPAGAAAGDISTVAGGGQEALCPTAWNAQLDDPTGVAIGPDDETYVVDSLNHRIRRIPQHGGNIETVAGNGTAASTGDGGPATSASLNRPYGVAVDPDGNLYISEFMGHRVRRVDAVTGTITTVVGDGTASSTGDGGLAGDATVNGPIGLAFDAAGNLHVAEYTGSRIRRIDKVTGVISPVAGTGTPSFGGDDGPATNAHLNQPYSMAFEDSGDLLIADTDNHRIRQVAAGTGTITTIAGTGVAGSSGDGGPATGAQLNRPYGLMVLDGTVHLTDYNNHRVRAFVPGSIIVPVAGTGTQGSDGDNGSAFLAELFRPASLAVDSHGNIALVDRGNDRVRRIHPSVPTTITRVAGSAAAYSGDCTPPLAAEVNLDEIKDVEVDVDGTVFVPVDYPDPGVLRVDGEDGTITVLAGTGYALADGAPATQTILDTPASLALDAERRLHIADPANARVRTVDLDTGIIATTAGTGVGGDTGDGGPATSARLGEPTGLAIDDEGNLHIADYGYYRVRTVDLDTGIINPTAGSGEYGDTGDGGPALFARLAAPRALAVDADGDLHIADGETNRVRTVDLDTGIITATAGSGAYGDAGDGGPATEAEFQGLSGLAIDIDGDLHVADESANRVRTVDLDTGIITGTAGSGAHGDAGDGGPATAAEMNGPHGLAVDANGDLLIADRSNGRVRLVEQPQQPTGFLRVTTNPALPVTISVDGTPRDSWGLNWVPFPAGQHEVCFSDLPGYGTPACQDVIVGTGTTTNVVGTYTARGFLRVITSPAVPSTITVDGIPRNDWGVWTEVDPGTYDVCFGEVADFTPPDCREVTVSAGATATTTGTFTSSPGAPSPGGSYGYVRATTDPAVGSRISIDGEWRDSWGLTWVKIPTGAHQVCWEPVAKAETPPCQDIDVTPGGTTAVTGTFAQHGFLRVLTSPALPATIRVDGHRANVWGVWTNRPPGSYQVCFDPAPGYTAPPCQDVDITAGATAEVTGTYS